MNRRANFSDYFGAYAFALLCYSGPVKATPFFSWVPLDITLFAGALTLLAIAHAYLHKTTPPFGVFLPTLLLWGLFVPGAIIAVFNQYPAARYTTLFTITFLCAVAPFLIFTSERRREIWLQSHIAFGVLMAIGLVIFPASQSAANTGRLGVSGATSILTAWVLCASVLVGTHFALRSQGMPFAFWVVSSSILAVSAVLVGSRGPIVALAAGLAVLAFANIKHTGPFGVIAITSVIAVPMLFITLFADRNLAAERMLDLLTGESDDSGRSLFYEIAMAEFMDNPMGLGWAGYSRLADVILLSGSEETYAHNILLDIAVDGGVFAAIGSFIYFIRPVVISLSAAVPSLPVFGSLVTFWLVAGTFSSDINGNRMLWASVGVAAITIYMVKTQASSAEAAEDRTADVPGSR